MNETPTFWDNFGANLRIAAKQLSSYVIIAAGVYIQSWAALPEGEVARQLGGFDFLAFLVPYAGWITIILGVAAKAWPQKAVTNEVIRQAVVNAPEKVAQAADDIAARR